MRAILVNEKTFDRLFQECFDKLQLVQFVTPNIARDPRDVQMTDDMHRKFHYYVAKLKRDLMDAGSEIG